MSSAYDATVRAWKTRFGAPYSVCGCAPEPAPTSTLGSKLTSKVFKSAKPGKSTEFRNERPDLVSAEEEGADATHPSEHNSVTVIGYAYGEMRKKSRTEEIQRRVRDATRQHQKNEEKQGATTWTDIQIRNRQKGGEGHTEAYSTAYTYDSLRPFGDYGYVFVFSVSRYR